MRLEIFFFLGKRQLTLQNFHPTERVQTDRAQCHFSVHAPSKEAGTSENSKACTYRLHRMLFFRTRSVKRGRNVRKFQSVYIQIAQNAVFLYTIHQKRPERQKIPERVHTYCTGCGFSIHALKKQAAKVGRLPEVFRSSASSGGYLVGGAPDPNHLSDASA
jgi:hypothetical protein